MMETQTPSAERAPVLKDSGLGALLRIAVEGGADDIAVEVQKLADRVEQGRFYVACVGQFKRGKSTLVNALVEKPVLPTGVAPVTSAVTILRYGLNEGGRVFFGNGRSEEIEFSQIAQFVTEAENPENVKGVTAVEVFVRSPLLADGMCLVDTPGLGSVFAGNAAITREFVPHIDAALVVIGADPPISGDELALVQDIASQVDTLVFVLNKADRLSDAERKEATCFAREVVAKRLRRVETIYEVSAKELLAGRSTRDWGPLYQRLDNLARQSGADLVQSARERGMDRLAGMLERDLDEQRDALVRPLDESQKRLDALRGYVAEAERSLRDLAYLFTAEQDRLSNAFDQRKESFLQRAVPEAFDRLAEALRTAPERSGPALRRLSWDIAGEVANESLVRWRPEIEPIAEQMYRQATDRFVGMANDFLGRLAGSGVPGMDALPRALGPESGFRVRSRLYYTQLLTLTSATVLNWLLDRLLPRKIALERIIRNAGEYLERLLRANTSRIANDLRERVLESRRQLESDIRRHLRRVFTIAEHALERARRQQAEGAEAVQAELTRIEGLQRELQALRAKIGTREHR